MKVCATNSKWSDHWGCSPMSPWAGCQDWYIGPMRKLFALAIAFFFLLQSTAALAVPVEHCCLEDCKAMSCSIAVCQACTAPVAVEGSLGGLIPQPREVQFPAGNEASPDSAPQDIWRPPD